MIEFEFLGREVLIQGKPDIMYLMKQLTPSSTLEECEKKYNALHNFIVGGSAIVFVAKDNQRIIAYIWGYHRYNEGQERIHVTQLVVEENHRGSGIGNRLLQMMNSYALQNNYSAVELNVLADNMRGLRFYLKNGYEAGHIFMKHNITRLKSGGGRLFAFN